MLLQQEDGYQSVGHGLFHCRVVYVSAMLRCKAINAMAMLLMLMMTMTMEGRRG